MRSTGSGPLGALLMLAPLIAVPILAVVGIPQFAPGNLVDGQKSNSRGADREHRAPEEPGYGDDTRHDADDLFAPNDQSERDTADFEDPLADNKPRRKQARGQRDEDFGFEEEAPSQKSKSGRQRIDDEQLAEDPPEFEAADEFSDSPAKKRAAPRRGERTASLEDDVGVSDVPKGQRPGSQRRPSKPAAEDYEFAMQSEESNLFDAPSNKRSIRPGSSKKSTKPLDPNDAPIFEPQTSSTADERQPEEQEEAVQPPAPKAPPLGKRGVTAPPAEDAEEATAEDAEQFEEEPAKQANPEAEQPPQVDELTWQTATQRLRKLGVGATKHYFTYLEDRDLFLFTCEALSADRTQTKKRFQAEADEPLLAVKQVLEKLEAWHGTTTKQRARATDRAVERQ